MMYEKTIPRDPPEAIAPETLSQGCGWCGQSSWFRRRAAVWAGWGSWVSAGRLEYLPRLAGIYQCGGCQNASLNLWYATSGVSGELYIHVDHIWPTPQAAGMADLPQEVQADRVEAWNSHLSGQHRAAVLMARTALQRAVRVLLAGQDGVLNEQDKGSLFSELDLLVKRQVITPQLRQNADEVRLSGNDVAHPEELGAVSQAEAEDSLVFLDDFLETTLAVPARQRKRRAQRQVTGKGTTDVTE
jgi:Domain of unknown function (DUF4145)